MAKWTLLLSSIVYMVFETGVFHTRVILVNDLLDTVSIYGMVYMGSETEYFILVLYL